MYVSPQRAWTDEWLIYHFKAILIWVTQNFISLFMRIPATLVEVKSGKQSFLQAKLIQVNFKFKKITET